MRAASKSSRVGRATAAGRTGSALAIVATAALGLTGCIPSPPPVPQATPAAPIVPGQTDAGDVRDGRVPSGGAARLPLTIDERTAVVIGATSTDGEDLTLRLTGPAVDIENDDADRADVFAFEGQSLDPAVATVLDPGAYTIEVEEWGGDATGFQLQVLTSSTTLGTGESARFSFGPGQPVIAMVTTEQGDEAISATSDIDTTLWAYVPESDTDYHDDDSGGDRNPRIELAGEAAQAIVVVATGYARDASGSLELRVD